MSDAGTITKLLHEVRDGDPEAFDRLLPLVYEELRRLARWQLRRQRDGHTLRTSDLVHEAYLKMANQAPVDWESRSHFYCVAARAMRQVLIDYARKRAAKKRGGDRARVSLASRHLAFDIQWADLLTLDTALDRLKALDKRQGTIVECRFFGGMTEKEIAAVLGLSTRTIQREWRKARLFLHRAVYPNAE